MIALAWLPLSKITWTFIKFPEELNLETPAVAVCKRMFFELFDKFIAEVALRLSLSLEYVPIAILWFLLHL